MTLHVLSNYTPADATYVNDMSNEILTASLLNTIRTLIDRTASFSAGYLDCFADAYIDSNGRNNSVASATALYDATEYIYFPFDVTDEASGDSTSDPNSYTNPSYAFDGDDTTYANKDYTADNSTLDTTLGKTFGAKNIEVVFYKVYFYIKNSSAPTYDRDVTITLETYNGATWSSVKTIVSSWEDTTSTTTTATISGYHILNTSVQGIRIHIVTSSGGPPGTSINHKHRVYSLEYGDYDPAEQTIAHTIPTGRFPATVSSAICVPLIKDWETGADIQFKLTNATEDSGWLEVMGTTTGKPAVQTFTAFTSEPTSLIVKLIPKTSSPTPGYPSILGVGCIAN